MTKRVQKTAALALGAAAAVLIVCVLWRGARARQAAAVSLSPAVFAAVTDSARLDLNAATEAELRELPGIGEVLAERIVRWREENGGFHTREDVLAVQGIGEATYESLAPFITY